MNEFRRLAAKIEQTTTPRARWPDGAATRTCSSSVGIHHICMPPARTALTLSGGEVRSSPNAIRAVPFG